MQSVEEEMAVAVEGDPLGGWDTGWGCDLNVQPNRSGERMSSRYTQA